MYYISCTSLLLRKKGPLEGFARRGGREILRPTELFSRALIAIAVVSLLSAPSTPALAQGKGAPAGNKDAADPKDKARELYKQGAKAIEEGKHAEGLALIEQAEALFHAPTHILLIAKARIALGRLVEARDAYQKLVDEELAAKASDAFKEAKATAKSEIVVLDKRIPKLRLLPEPPDAAGLSVTMNGQPVAAERFSAPFPVDPGSYVFEAKADGMEAARVTVEAVERSSTDVRLVLNKIGTKKPVNDVVTPVPSSGWPAMKIAGVSLIVVGGAALAGGGALGILHFITRSSADDKFDECGASCEQDVRSMDADAALFGNIAIGALAGGGALLGTGIVLFAIAPSGAPADEAPAAVTVSVQASPSGVWLSGSF